MSNPPTERLAPEQPINWLTIAATRPCSCMATPEEFAEGKYSLCQPCSAKAALARISGLEAELQEAREQRDLAKADVDRLVRAYPKAEKDAINLWRSQLVEAVRAHVQQDPAGQRLIALIQSFNPVPDDVLAQLAPVHDEEPRD